MRARCDATCCCGAVCCMARDVLLRHTAAAGAAGKSQAVLSWGIYRMRVYESMRARGYVGCLAFGLQPIGLGLDCLTG